MTGALEVSCGLLLCFSLAVLAVTLHRFRKLFLPRHGRRHRLAGLAYGAWLILGVAHIGWNCFGKHRPSQISYVAYDVVLGVLGSMLTLTAALDFAYHKDNYIQTSSASSQTDCPKTSSGVLEPDATVSRSEMFEHLFYQLLNLVQAVYLWSQSWASELELRLVLLLCVTAPWLARSSFPVNSFSANYSAAKKASNGYSAEIGLMYRIKKYQYVFYKHFLLHGLNISIALQTNQTKLVDTLDWRLYWVCLNAAYTTEFFLQTLVKRKHIPQPAMLALNKTLMAASSIAALYVLRHVSIFAAVLSFGLNMVHRHHEMSNMIIVVCTIFASRYLCTATGRHIGLDI